MDDKRAPTQDKRGRFVPGNAGGGRPRGARSKLGEAFMEALLASFQEHGAATIERVRQEKPEQYLKIIASLLPKELELTEELQDTLAQIILARRDRVERSALH
jgi:hypothetical protein